MNLLPFNPRQSGSLIEAGGQSVYFLATLDRSQVKIGRSVAPLRRIHGLRCLYPDIDLTRSAIVAVDDHRLEKVLHTAFGKRRQTRSGKKDGHTEWFKGDIVEQAVALAHVIATHRETRYPEFRGVDRLVADYLKRNPEVAQRTQRLSKAERLTKTMNAEAQLVERVLSRTQEFIDLLDERVFDAVVHRDGQTYLARMVHRDAEPECWLPDGAHRMSDWGRRLCGLGLINEKIDGTSCLFYLLDCASFVPQGLMSGIEYYRIPKSAPRTETDHCGISAVSSEASAELWEAIKSLPVKDASTDFMSKSSRPHSGR